MQRALIERIATGTLYVLAATAVWFVLPISADVIEIPKRAVLFLAALIFTILWIIQTVRENNVRVTITPFLLPGLGLFAATALSAFLATPNPEEGLVAGGLLYGCIAAILLFAPGLVRPKTSNIFTALNVGGLVLAVTALLQIFDTGLAKFINDNFHLSLVNNAAFSLTGSIYTGLGVLAVLAFANIGWLLSTKEKGEKSLSAFFLMVSLIGIALHGYVLLIKFPGQLLITPLQASWSVAIDMLKSPRTALIGAGPASYSVAFNQFRPATLNTSKLWAVRFDVGSIVPLHLLTTIGVLGLLAWFAAMSGLFRLGMASRKQSLALTFLSVGLVVVQFLLPPSTPVWIMFAVTAVTLTSSLRGQSKTHIKDMLLGLIAGETSNPLTFHTPNFRWFAISAAGVVAIASAWSTWQMARVLYAENLFMQSVQAANWNDAIGVYDKQRMLVQFNGNNDVGLRTFAATNFLLAKNLAQQKDLSDADRQKLPVLIQQAVDSAKRATALDQRKTENWESLASIYDQLIGTVNQADQYAVSAYVRAIQTNPTNPALRMALGSVYARANNLEQAKMLYQQTIELKPDWPNAYYNLSVIFRAQKNLSFALQALQFARQYTDPASKDIEQLDKEINDLTAEVKKQEQDLKAQEEAAAAKAAKAAGAAPNGQIKIPEDLGLPKEDAPLTLPEGPKPQAATPKPLGTTIPKPTGSASPSSTPKSTENQ